VTSPSCSRNYNEDPLLQYSNRSSQGYPNKFYPVRFHLLYNPFFPNPDKNMKAVQQLGFKKLGFHPEEVGTHSNSSGGAMGMFLAGTPV
jgi:hypothetical protein